MEELIKPSKIYFRNLDSIRFFAALMVFFRHGIEDGYKYLNIHGTILGRFLYAISDGGVGVSIFFVLSGFLITYLILSEINLTQKFSLKNFYIRRVLRIWPLYFAVVAIGFLLFPALRSLLKIDTISDGASPWYQCAFISNFDVIHINKLNPNALETMHSITWSVSIEEQFYAVWPLIFAFLPRKLFLPTIVSVLFGSLVFRFYNLGDFYTLYFHTLSAMLYLGTGALFAYLIISSNKVKEFFQQTSSFAILGSFVLFFISMMYRDIIFGSSIGTLIEPAYFALLFAFIIASQSMMAPDSKLGLGNIRIANKLGKYTYGMYLLHPIAIMIIQAICIKVLHIQMTNFLNIFISGIFGLLLTILIAWFSYEYYESRFLAFKKSFSVITK